MIKAIFEHRTIRKYKSDSIEDEQLNKILKAASRASNTGNMQVYSIIVTKDSDIKSQLLGCHFNQKMVTDAPVVLTFCADFNRFNKWCECRNAKPGYDNFLSFYTASIDAVIAAQNAAIQAEDEGLGICYLGTTNYTAAKIVEILKLPKGVVPVTTLVVGYADEQPKLTDRLPLEAIVHNNVYHDYTKDDINNLYSEKENLDETKDLIKVNETETLAQIFTEKRYTKTNNIHFSKEYLDVISKQGFMNHE
ncbi:MAG TPA: NADPH-dependent oxidoreductase [Bacteroidales bacterium]|nr:MAG: NADPH-dependent oxidoreductase [Bacteroidetes bacterium GWF2_33_38]OFY69598.1 MAG: NADPH-dependent oxidoreductase [Bacteroidetes bacterium RIFOXYA12_FULL_33_9]OFY86064.1 MAG: NADPH-dependent oxidoreductase [Bacteroidetes bacterium RIFOXYA2_FULL_33_7]HBF87680.1 NADPH-dependent oxidoreductase [Bacteroidales bacterium]